MPSLSRNQCIGAIALTTLCAAAATLWYLKIKPVHPVIDHSSTKQPTHVPPAPTAITVLTSPALVPTPPSPSGSPKSLETSTEEEESYMPTFHPQTPVAQKPQDPSVEAWLGPHREPAIKPLGWNTQPPEDVFGQCKDRLRDTFTIDHFLSMAAGEQDIQAVKWALEQGANPNFTDINHVSPIQYAQNYENKALIALLVEHKANPDPQPVLKNKT